MYPQNEIHFFGERHVIEVWWDYKLLCLFCSFSITETSENATEKVISVKVKKLKVKKKEKRVKSVKINISTDKPNRYHNCICLKNYFTISHI